MARQFVSYSIAHSVSVFIEDAKHSVSVTIQDTNVDKRHTVSVFKSDTQESADRRVVGKISLSEKLPNLFYGFSEPSRGTVKLDNTDGFLNFLLNEDVRRQPIRIRRVDESNSEDDTLIVGIIDAYTVGDEVVLEYVSHDLNVFEQELPKNKILTKTSPQTPSATDIVIDNVFPDATDQNAPIPIVFGRVPRVRCSLVKSDSNASQHDYIVCEGKAEIERVFKNGVPGYTESATLVSGVYNVGEYGFIELDQAHASTIFDFYDKMFIRISYGPGYGEERQIVGYDNVHTRILKVWPAWIVSPQDDKNPVSGTSRYEIREFGTLNNNEYPNRTAIRFRQAVKDSVTKDLQEVTATAVRYNAPTKNLLRWTEHFEYEGDEADGFGVWEGTRSLPYVNQVESGVSDPRGLKHANGIHWGANDATMQRVFNSDHSPYNTQSGDEYTFSVWARLSNDDPQSSRNFRMTITESGANATTVTKTATKSWQRFSTSNDGSVVTWTGNQLRVLLQTDIGGSGEYLQFFGAQLEVGMSMTAYEPVHATGEGYSWLHSDAIKELLTDPVFGLGEPIDKSSFDTVRGVLEVLPVTCQGVIPSLDGGGGTRAKDILDQLLRIRGMYITRSDGAWKLNIDAAKSSIGVLGSLDTPEQNLISVSGVQKSKIEDHVKTVTVKYNMSRSEDAKTTLFKGELTKTVSANGTDLIVENRFARDDVSADYQVQYLAKKLAKLQETRSVTTGQAGRNNIVLNDRVTLRVPRTMSENRLLYSENLTQSAWTISDVPSSPATTITLQDGRNHEGKGQRISTVAFPAHTSGDTHEVYQDIGSNIANTLVVCTFWVRAASSSNVVTDGKLIFRIVNLTGSVVTTNATPIIGTAWQKVQLKHRFRSTETGALRCQIRTQLTSGAAAVTIQVAQVQVAYEYNYQYVTTGASAKPVSEDWQIIELTRQDVEQTELKLIEYDSTVFDYTQTSEATEDGTPTIGDTSTLNRVPSQPTFFSVPDGNSPGAAAGVDVYENDSGEETAVVWAYFSVGIPADENVVQIDIEGARRPTEKNFQFDVWKSYIVTAGDRGKTVDIYVKGIPVEPSADAANPTVRYWVRPICVSAAGGRVTGGDASSKGKTWIPPEKPTLP